MSTASTPAVSPSAVPSSAGPPAAGPDGATRLARRPLLLAGTVALTLLILGLVLSGATAPRLLADPGPLVRWGQPVVALGARLAGAVAVGGLVLCAVVLPTRSPSWRRAATLSAAAALTWSFVQTAALVLTHAALTGAGALPGAYAYHLLAFVTGVPLGSALGWAVVLTAACAVAAVVASSRAGVVVALVLALASLAPTAAGGHVAGAPSHQLAASSMWLHVSAAAVWVGGVAVLVAVAGGLRHDLGAAGSRFSAVAGWCFVLVAGSGLVNGIAWVDDPLAALGTPWGLLLGAKIVAFGVLGVFGWWHRRVTLPAIAAASVDQPRTGLFARVLAVELTVMAAVFGVSVALGTTAPPPLLPVPVPVPPEPSLASYLAQSSPEPLFLAAAAAGVVVYLRWVRRLARRGDAWPVGRTVSWLVGMAGLAWVTSGGPAVYAELQLSGHVLQHMVLVVVLPICYVLAAPVGLGLRALPRRSDGSTGPREALLALLHSRWARFFGHPVVAALHFVVAMAALYLTPLLDLVLRGHLAHVLMVVHLSLVGYLFVNVLIGTDPGPRRPPYPLRLVLLVPAMVFHTFFGLLLLSGQVPLADAHFGAVAPPWGTDLAADQQVAGAIVWSLGEVPAIGLALIVAAAWSRRHERTERGYASDGATEPPDAGEAATAGPSWPGRDGSRSNTGARRSVSVANPAASSTASLPESPRSATSE